MLDLERLNIDAGMSFEDANTLLYRLGITDGLPVVPPTGDRVAAMVGERESVPGGGDATADAGPGNGAGTGHVRRHGGVSTR